MHYKNMRLLKNSDEAQSVFQYLKDLVVGLQELDDHLQELLVDDNLKELAYCSFDRILAS